MVAQKKEPRATRTIDGGVVLQFPWVNYVTPGLVEALKDEIPAYAREYNPHTKLWRITFLYADHAIALLREAFPEARVVDAEASYRRQAPPPSPRPPLARESHYAVLCVTPAAPPEIVSAVYRAWCKLTHPDALPAPERDRATRRMQEINAAYEALKAQGAAA